MRRWGDFALENEGRLTHPLRYDAALDRYVLIVGGGRLPASRDSELHPGRNMVAFYALGRAPDEAIKIF